MTRKEKNLIKEEIKQLEIDINSKLLNALGMDVSRGFVVDQDNFSRVRMGKKYIKYSPFAETLVHSGDLVFNPLNNNKMVVHLFNIFLQKEQEENDLYVSTYYPIITGDMTCVEIQKSEYGNISLYRSDNYKSPSYGYIEIILELFGIHYSDKLHRLDELMSYDL